MGAAADPCTSAEIVIVGGGLAGLALADRLEAAGRDWRLIEARPRLGGRVLSRPAESGSALQFDLGPAWLWPHNHRLRGLADRLGLQVFPQFAEGRLVFEDDAGRVRRDLELTPMAGSLRLDGGLAGLVDGLAAGLPAARLETSTTVGTITRDADAVRLGFDGSAGPRAGVSERVVLALPPRLAATLAFDPPLPEAVRRARASVPTWMAAHAKMVAVYDRPFWREHGLSGDAISHRGPLMEIHDASPHDGARGALFGFVGVPFAVRERDPKALQVAAIDQLARLFGVEAAAPRAVLWQDWAAEPYTATAADSDASGGHPAYGPLPAAEGPWVDRLLLAGSEVAPAEGGFLEGALIAAEAAAANLLGRAPVSLR